MPRAHTPLLPSDGSAGFERAGLDMIWTCRSHPSTAGTIVVGRPLAAEPQGAVKDVFVPEDIPDFFKSSPPNLGTASVIPDQPDGLRRSTRVVKMATDVTKEKGQQGTKRAERKGTNAAVVNNPQSQKRKAVGFVDEYEFNLSESPGPADKAIAGDDPSHRNPKRQKQKGVMHPPPLVSNKEAAHTPPNLVADRQAKTSRARRIPKQPIISRLGGRTGNAIAGRESKLKGKDQTSSTETFQPRSESARPSLVSGPFSAVQSRHDDLSRGRDARPKPDGVDGTMSPELPRPTVNSRARSAKVVKSTATQRMDEGASTQDANINATEDQKAPSRPEFPSSPIVRSASNESDAISEALALGLKDTRVGALSFAKTSKEMLPSGQSGCKVNDAKACQHELPPISSIQTSRMQHKQSRIGAAAVNANQPDLACKLKAGIEHREDMPEASSRRDQPQPGHVISSDPARLNSQNAIRRPGFETEGATNKDRNYERGDGAAYDNFLRAVKCPPRNTANSVIKEHKAIKNAAVQVQLARSEPSGTVPTVATHSTKHNKTPPVQYDIYSLSSPCEKLKTNNTRDSKKRQVVFDRDSYKLRPRLSPGVVLSSALLMTSDTVRHGQGIPDEPSSGSLHRIPQMKLGNSSMPADKPMGMNSFEFSQSAKVLPRSLHDGDLRPTRHENVEHPVPASYTETQAKAFETRVLKSLESNRIQGHEQPSQPTAPGFNLTPPGDQGSDIWKMRIKEDGNGIYHAVHEIARTLLRHLKSKEHAIDDVIDDYRQQGIRLVDRLAGNHKREQAHLVHHYKGHQQDFVNIVKGASQKLADLTERLQSTDVRSVLTDWQVKSNDILVQLKALQNSFGSA